MHGENKFGEEQIIAYKGNSMPRINELERSPIHLLHRALQHVEVAFHRSLGENALTARQLVVMAAVAGGDGLNQTQIVQLTGMDRSTLAELMKRLVKRGWVERRRSRADTRAYVVRLSSEGEQTLKKGLALARKVDSLLLNALGEAKVNAFLTRLDTIVTTLERHE